MADNKLPQVDPLDFSDKYNTPIPADKQNNFNNWVSNSIAKTGKSPLNDRYDYDVNGFFLSGAGKDSNGHSTDLYKKPNHPTFSNESMYHGKDGYQGGSWITQGGKTFYQPSTTNILLHGRDNLHKYFSSTEPDIQLLMPPMMPHEILQGVVK